MVNRLKSFGRRGIVIVFLSVSLAAVTVFALRQSAVSPDEPVEDRAQLYGDPAVLNPLSRDSWRAVFSDPGDRLLADHAIPAVECHCASLTEAAQAEAVAALEKAARALVAVYPTDLAEVAKMKRMVNGMKRELSVYLDAGGTAADYLERLDIRQQAERAIYERTALELHRTDDPDVWLKRNSELRAMGLPMVPVDEPAQ